MSEQRRERNKAPAEFQITAEQILLEAYERKNDPINKTQVKIADLEELQELLRRKRQEYEDALRRNRLDFPQWMRYAQFELDHKELRRARSIFERALEINAHHVPLWIRYIDSEIKTRNINHARNLFDRVTTLLPRIDKFWFRYVQTEETLQNIIGTRQVFQRWMQWEPDTPAWDAYVNFEKRYDEFDNVRAVFNQYVRVHPVAETWIKWTRFESDYGDPSSVREVFTAGIDTLPNDDKLITHFAKWEATQREWERARAIFKFGLAKFPNSKLINDELTHFEKQFGDKEGIEDSILAKRKQKYESELKEDPYDYDTWWSYLYLLEDSSAEVRREAFESSVVNAPRSAEKVHWKRYIFLWIRYAIFEELQGQLENAREVYKRATKVIPKKFTFSSIWILYSNFEIRQGNLSQARKLLGYSIGSFPKQKTFRHYIQLEIKLKEFDRVRKIYEKELESFPNKPSVWIEYAELESELNDLERSRAIYELAIDLLSTGKQLVWDKYVEFEVDQSEYDNARKLYKRQLDADMDSTTIWIKSALFELTVPTEKQLLDYEKEVEESGDYELEFTFEVSEESISRAKIIFEDSLKYFKKSKQNEQRVVIFEAFKQFEMTHGTIESQEALEKRMPTVVKKKKTLEDGSIKEYYDYIFPDDKKMSKFLEMAKKWNKQTT